jgi:hypothetical protein
MARLRGRPGEVQPEVTNKLPEGGQIFTGVATNRDATGASLVRRDYSGTSGEGRLALPISNEQFWSDFCSKRIVDVLEPDKLSLQVAYSLLKAAHLRDDAGIWPADVAE